MEQLPGCWDSDSFTRQDQILVDAVMLHHLLSPKKPEMAIEWIVSRVKNHESLHTIIQSLVIHGLAAGGWTRPELDRLSASLQEVYNRDLLVIAVGRLLVPRQLLP